LVLCKDIERSSFFSFESFCHEAQQATSKASVTRHSRLPSNQLELTTQSSSAINATAHETKPAELPRGLAEPVDTVSWPQGRRS